MSKITFEGTRKELGRFSRSLDEAEICPFHGEYCPEPADLDFCPECLRAHIKFIPAARWRARLGKMYYWVTSKGEVDNDVETGHEIDTGRYKAGNYYETEEQAEAAAERVRAAYIEES